MIFQIQGYDFNGLELIESVRQNELIAGMSKRILFLILHHSPEHCYIEKKLHGDFHSKFVYFPYIFKLCLQENRQNSNKNPSHMIKQCSEL